MAEKNKTTKKKKNGASDIYEEYTSPFTKPGAAGTKGQSAREETPRAKKEKKPANPSSVGNQIMIALFVALAIFLGMCYGLTDEVGTIGAAIARFLPGLFGGAALILPFTLLFHALYWKKDTASGMRAIRFTFSFSVLFFLSVLLHLIFVANGTISADGTLWEMMKQFYPVGIEYVGGGSIGGLIATLAIRGIGLPGSFIFDILFLLISLILFVGQTPSSVWHQLILSFARWFDGRKARRAEREYRKAQAAAYRREEEERRAREQTAMRDSRVTPVYTPVRRTESSVRRHGTIDESILYGEAIPDIKPKEDDYEWRPDSAAAKAARSEPARDEEIVPSFSAKPDEYPESVPAEKPIRTEKKPTETEEDFFEEYTRTPVHRQPAEREKAEEKPKEKAEERPRAKAESVAPIILGPTGGAAVPEEPAGPAYRFPPIDLLQKPKAKSAGASEEDFTLNADKLMETLNNFNVHARIVGISHGPTITRYEIGLEAGTRVRTITNLVDDISLALATSGVRIEGVIPGKSAIGIEVPNRSSDFVYVRDLIERNEFTDAKSRLTTALGKGVAGEPIYLTIDKMPHLLIAGTTGSGKSVCINSMLVSLLYKAKPDEVKLVLIDPKKVELNIYNGLPHLLVPVVFDPKKAAGALHWCVTEMERRFDLIESMNMRNLEMYNRAIAGDPTKEKLPQIVIVIDELADLMMTASNEVEASICRLAQKARAAGMHLIVGTQRPSVDVITGLIKANIPSRIAFTVMSQVDSRTILDVAGAEKLIGHGDMLYAPVGSMKPARVQGAYVSEKEIEDVIRFIKEQNVEDQVIYSGEIMEQIEKEAALCGKKGKAAMDGEDGDEPAEKTDPMLDAAIKVAFESGKISTSLIQRRLSLGFGRAAKLIDIMEQRGIVSPPEGQKPRTLLISYDEYLEMSMSNPTSGGDGE